ncbi:rhamnan synthesis F family protein [Paucilactobacillus kaifaensis]|uniref:rhamnan synthesis F family protein n=1 Tax=Paucilactobacillus kaifaensis TaxID=2559921 RepID=UPI0010F60014|nr:rhamnan synthesis F family protein [Paucilactobacillus kaifaensis]
MFYKKYHMFAIRRYLKRKLYQRKNKKLVRKNKNKKILVVLHLFYQNSWIEIKEYLKNLDNYDWQLVITYPKSLENKFDFKDIRKFKADTKMIGYENKGYDVAPFIFAVKSMDLGKYDVVFKIQSKGIGRKKIFIYKQLFFYRDWFLNLFEGILGAKNIDRVIDCVSSDEYDMSAASNLFVSDPVHKKHIVKGNLEKRDLSIDKKYHFVAGTCFAISSSFLQKNINSIHVEMKEFKKTPSTRGMSLAHVLERYISTCNEERFYGTNVMSIRRFLKKPLEKIYYNLSTEKNLKQYNINDQFFFSEFDNRMGIGVEKEVILGNLGVISAITNRFQPIEETIPYQYLEGNVDLYEKYAEFHKKNNYPLMTTDRFDNLIESVKIHGYDSSFPIIIHEGNVIMDGQHRACIEAYNNGLDFKMKVLQVTMINKRWLLKIIIPKFILKKYHQKKFGYS